MDPCLFSWVALSLIVWETWWMDAWNTSRLHFVILKRNLKLKVNLFDLLRTCCTTNSKRSRTNLQVHNKLKAVHYAVVTCEIQLFWNNFEIISVFYFTCNLVCNYFKIISATLKMLEKYSWAAISLWNYFEIILGKIISVGTPTKAEIMLK